MLQVNLEDAGCRRSSARSTGVIELLALVERFLQPMTYLVPRPLVLRLFLAPDDFFDVPVLFEERGVLRDREGIELLDANDRDVVDAVHLARLEQVVIDLAAAEDDPPRFFRRDLLSLGDDELETAI